MAKVAPEGPGDIQKQRDELNARLKDASLKGAWQREPRKKQPEILPWLWRWDDIAPNLLAAGDLIPIDDVMRMRTISLLNASHPVDVGTVNTFGVTVQLLNPGEITESHRHTSASLYFVIEGDGCFTTAEGEQQFMEAGDLLVQPSWTWHGTKNAGTEPALWLTAMDTPINQFFEAYFREKYPDDFLQPVSQPDGYNAMRMGATRVPGGPDDRARLPIKYRWADTIRALEALSDADEADPHDGVVLEYANPLTGGATTETLGCRVQMLRPGEATVSHRHTGNTIYHVVRGAGATIVDGQGRDARTLEWAERDCFMVPSWQWHRFENRAAGEPAILFSVSDRPVLDALRLYREESRSNSPGAAGA